MVPNPVQLHPSGIVDILVPVTGARRECVPCASVSPATQIVPRILSLKVRFRSLVISPCIGHVTLPITHFYNTYHYTFVYFIFLTHKVLCLS